jgi:hypothetical protein
MLIQITNALFSWGNFAQIADEAIQLYTELNTVSFCGVVIAFLPALRAQFLPTISSQLQAPLKYLLDQSSDLFKRNTIPNPY